MLITANSKLTLPAIPEVPQKIDLYTNSGPFSAECQIDANNDLEAVLKWLEQYKNKATTYRTYKRESLRFLLWCSCEAGKNLISLKVVDLENYLKFLQNPPKSWCAPRSGKKSTNRPFVGALSIAAFQCGVRVINSLFNYLVKADYLRTNPLKLIRTSQAFNLTSEDRKYQVWARMLEIDEWQAILDVLNNMPENTKDEIDLKIRTQLLVALLYLLGLRISEVVEHSWNSFRLMDGKWWFFVKGKGDKPGHIPVNDKLLDYIKAYRLHLGIDALPQAYETEHMIVSYKNRKAYSLRMLYNMVKDVGIKASKVFAKNKLKQEKLQKFSPHWLRHLAASHQDKAGMSMNMIQENMRHSSHNTTRIYMHSEDNDRHAAIQNIDFNNVVPVNLIDNNTTEQLLSIKVKSKGIDSAKSFARFLDALERNLFKSADFRFVQDRASILTQFMHFDKFGEYYLFKCRLSSLYNNIRYIDMIKREAQIRLLDIIVNQI